MTSASGCHPDRSQARFHRQVERSIFDPRIPVGFRQARRMPIRTSHPCPNPLHRKRLWRLLHFVFSTAPWFLSNCPCSPRLAVQGIRDLRGPGAGSCVLIVEVRYRRERWITPDGRSAVVAGVCPRGRSATSAPSSERFDARSVSPGPSDGTADRRAIAATSGWRSPSVSSRASSHRRQGGLPGSRRPVCLRAGSRARRGSQSSDTGARYKGMNGACTHIGNTDFAWLRHHPREEPAELPGAFAGLRRHRLRRSFDEALAYMRGRSLSVPG